MMKSHKVTSAEDYKIVSSFQSLRKTLLEEKFADRLEKPLAYWAMPNDRRLPLAFLGRTIKDLLDTPFEELSATPGIGQKKISSLVKLLSRATKDHPPAVPFGMNDLAEAKRAAGKSGRRKSPRPMFDPAIVSEALWTQWLETARKHDVGREKLGRLAPTLQALPTVIWQTPLEFYMQYSVSEIRQLKTHGEKRVRVVLEVFHIVHEMSADVAADRHLSVRLVPKFIEPLEETVAEWLRRSDAPTPEEVREELTVPLLDQLRIDTGDTIYQLSCGRLGIDGPAAKRAATVQADGRHPGPGVPIARRLCPRDGGSLARRQGAVGPAGPQAPDRSAAARRSQAAAVDGRAVLSRQAGTDGRRAGRGIGSRRVTAGQTGDVCATSQGGAA